ncbi:unnamed protein product [Pleuronectes platessa]|uniref:Uncharacterized protein n=1 Tax=Pleuronectes platessa TaxID=8262 RepID=A0A9N7TJF9_PLEPL|nr:unnamed protein product [Pleuronectes platessa]
MAQRFLQREDESAKNKKHKDYTALAQGNRQQADVVYSETGGGPGKERGSNFIVFNVLRIVQELAESLEEEKLLFESFSHDEVTAGQHLSDIMDLGVVSRLITELKKI